MTSIFMSKKLKKKLMVSLSIIARNYADMYLCNGEWMGGPEPYVDCVKRINPFILFGAMYQAHEIHSDFIKATEDEMKTMITFMLKAVFDRIQDHVAEVDYDYEAIAEASIIKACETMVHLNYNHTSYEAE